MRVPIEALQHSHPARRENTEKTGGAASTSPGRIKMKDLQAIKTAALEYRHADRDDEEWPVIESNFHILAADPERIVGLIEQMEAFGKLVRDMSGYIKLAG